MTEAAARSGATLLPIDSEHNAIFQCIACSERSDVAKIILTASGGPFRTASLDEMRRATPEQAVAHPNWSMGAKISVDSATMMNKGLELIEAHHLFGLPSQQIEIVIHPQSVVHSLVEFVDGSVLAQLGSPDMRIPIAYALAWPERMTTPAQRLDLLSIGSLDFEPADMERFPALRLSREALEAGGSSPTVLNAANEAAVARFLAGSLRYHQIVPCCQAVLENHEFDPRPSLEQLVKLDAWSREEVAQWNP
jgi:1-deoxy-D-xylulose-5-phosphate reductoisomerase